MAVQFVGRSVVQTNISSSNATPIDITALTGGVGTAAQAGDLVVVHLFAASNSDRGLHVVEPGWTEDAYLYYNDSIDAQLTVAHKVMGAVPDASVSFIANTGNSSSRIVAVAEVWRGVDQASPLDVPILTGGRANGLILAPPPITPVTTGAMIVAAQVGAHEAGAGQTYSASGYDTTFADGGFDGTHDVSAFLGHKAWSGGTFTPATPSFSWVDSARWSTVVVTYALRPASTGPTPATVSGAAAEVGSDATTWTAAAHASTSGLTSEADSDTNTGSVSSLTSTNGAVGEAGLDTGQGTASAPATASGAVGEAVEDAASGTITAGTAANVVGSAWEHAADATNGSVATIATANSTAWEVGNDTPNGTSNALGSVTGLSVEPSGDASQGDATAQSAPATATGSGVESSSDTTTGAVAVLVVASGASLEVGEGTANGHVAVFGSPNPARAYRVAAEARGWYPASEPREVAVANEARRYDARVQQRTVRVSPEIRRVIA